MIGTEDRSREAAFRRIGVYLMVTAASGASCAVAARPGAATGVCGCELWVRRRLSVVAGDVIVLAFEPTLLIVRLASLLLPCLVAVGQGPTSSASPAVLVVWWHRLESALVQAARSWKLVFLLVDANVRVWSLPSLSAARRAQRRRTVLANFCTVA